MNRQEKELKQKRREEIIEKLNTKYDGYDAYAHSNEALGVHIVRDIVKKIDTKGYWVDIVEHSNNDAGSYYGRYSPTYYIVCRLYKKLTKPEYPPKPSTDDTYALMNWQMEVDAITWHTAHKDIGTWKSRGYTGSAKTLVCYYEKLVTEDNGYREHIERRIKKVKCLNNAQFDAINSMYDLREIDEYLGLGIFKSKK